MLAMAVLANVKGSEVASCMRKAISLEYLPVQRDTRVEPLGFPKNAITHNTNQTYIFTARLE